MDGANVLEAVRASKQVELQRLGSGKALVAETEATLNREEVLAAAARAEARAAATFEAWADDEDDDTAREAFEQVAATERDHYTRVVGILGADIEAEAGPLHDHLRGLSGTPERVGAGLIGRALAADGTLLQTVNFFVNNAKESTADVFRELRADTEEIVALGVETLDAVCESDDDYDRAREAAEETIALIYEEYAATLEGLGLDPKPTC
ncbi:hypothetical protein [Natronomonas sp. EA1]|uniref:hypothetical protein n=1 Tax=Natronomonas sp. EA1 TaxID=3421655 RepID=UPI003EC09220